MKISIKNFILTGILSAFAVVGLISAGVKTSAQADRESANGHGTIVVQDEQGKNVKRQFSFNARRAADGTVSGNAVLHNASFTGANGKKYKASFDISCLKVVGNIAVIGGFIKRTNDPSLVDAAFFTVQDNGEPGKNSDRISGINFFDDNPSTTGSPSLCEQTSPNAFPFMTIDGGNIQVRGSAAQ